MRAGGPVDVLSSFPEQSRGAGRGQAVITASTSRSTPSRAPRSSDARSEPVRLHRRLRRGPAQRRRRPRRRRPDLPGRAVRLPLRPGPAGQPGPDPEPEVRPAGRAAHRGQQPAPGPGRAGAGRPACGAAGREPVRPDRRDLRAAPPAGRGRPRGRGRRPGDPAGAGPPRRRAGRLGRGGGAAGGGAGAGAGRAGAARAARRRGGPGTPSGWRGCPWPAAAGRTRTPRRWPSSGTGTSWRSGCTGPGGGGRTAGRTGRLGRAADPGRGRDAGARRGRAGRTRPADGSSTCSGAGHRHPGRAAPGRPEAAAPRPAQPGGVDRVRLAGDRQPPRLGRLRLHPRAFGSAGLVAAVLAGLELLTRRAVLLPLTVAAGGLVGLPVLPCRGSTPTS